MDSDAPNTSLAPSKEHAPWLPIPSCAISVVEHPCIVKNVDKGIASLGGPAKLSKGLRSKIETTTNAEGDDELKKLISVSLRPNDPFAKRLLSTPVRTNNILLKVTVPKRTGRKRRRGSTGPFLPDNKIEATEGLPAKQDFYLDASTVFRTLQDNASSYQVSIAGILDETHRFRNMPDLQYAASHNDVMVGLRDYILPQRYSRLQAYKLNTAAKRDLTKSVGPSAEFLQMPVAYNYRFQQSTFVKYTDQGVVNLHRKIAYDAYTIIKPTEDSVPTAPKPSLPAEETLTPYLQTLIKQIRAELAVRPIVTRHLLHNKLGWDKRHNIRHGMAYCGFFFESGPWREALVRWGLDPRKDAECRKYQTVSFLSYSKPGKTMQEAMLSRMSRQDLEHEHTFDGVTVSQTGKLFQFCDITDPLIAKILATDDIRATCAPTFQGWYHVGTWAKATVILKDKMNIILANGTPDDEIYQRIIEWPEVWDDDDMAAKYRAEITNRELHRERKREHDVMHSVRYAAKNPRYAFEKMETASPNERPAEDEDGHEEGSELDADDAGIPEDTTEDPVTIDKMLDDSSDEMDEEDDDEGFAIDEAGSDEELLEDDVEALFDVNADDDDEEEEDRPAVSVRAASEGPAPFGGYF